MDRLGHRELLDDRLYVAPGKGCEAWRVVNGSCSPNAAADVDRSVDGCAVSSDVLGMIDVLPVSDDVIAVVRSLDARWVCVAEDLGFGVARSDDAYVSYPGDGCIHIASAPNLDRDDTLAQIVLHELCHWLCEGPQSRGLPDWGLDNLTEADVPREHLALRVQLALSRRYDLQAVLVPTTDFRGYYADLFVAAPAASELTALDLAALDLAPVDLAALGEGRTGRWLQHSPGAPSDKPAIDDIRVVLDRIGRALRDTADSLRIAGLLSGRRG